MKSAFLSLVGLCVLTANSLAAQSEVTYRCTAINDCLDRQCSASDIVFSISILDGDGHSELNLLGIEFQLPKREEGHFEQEVDGVRVPLVLSSYGQPDYSNPTLTMSYLINADQTTDASIELDAASATRRINGNCILHSPEGQ